MEEYHALLKVLAYISTIIRVISTMPSFLLCSRPETIKTIPETRLLSLLDSIFHGIQYSS